MNLKIFRFHRFVDNVCDQLPPLIFNDNLSLKVMFLHPLIISALMFTATFMLIHYIIIHVLIFDIFYVSIHNFTCYRVIRGCLSHPKVTTYNHHVIFQVQYFSLQHKTNQNAGWFYMESFDDVRVVSDLFADKYWMNITLWLSEKSVVIFLIVFDLTACDKGRQMNRNENELKNLSENVENFICFCFFCNCRL